VLAGYTANNILPLRTGELVRAYLLGRAYGIRKSAVIASIAVERLFDGLTMLAFLLLAMTAASVSPTAELRRLALVAASSLPWHWRCWRPCCWAATTATGCWRSSSGPCPAGLGERIRSIASAFLGGLGSLRRGGDLLLVAATSLLAWGFEAAMYWAIAQGFGAALRPAFTPAAALLTTGVANLATLVPAAPATSARSKRG
jgi:uncharacterized protein (TIRG00374 family)